MPRNQALKLVEAYAAEDDIRSATRVYLENRISRKAYDEAVHKGRAFGKFIRERDAAKAAEQAETRNPS